MRSTSAWCGLGVILGGFPLARAQKVVERDKATGRDLIPVLQLTGLGELVYAAGIFAGLLLAR
jgi:1,4-dihydroxy-2-naphthoate octaprenyltransferase